MSAEVTGWLRENALPLNTLAAGSRREDLQPLVETLSDVRVVGMGESTHGTHEFFQLKHRLLEFLVTDMGFSVLAMEASASAGQAVDAYVRHGTGDAGTVLCGLGFWTWRTDKVLAVIEWMRAYNRERPENQQVRFVGIDPQRCGTSISELEAFLRVRVPERAAGLHAAFGVLGNAYPGQYPDLRRRLVHAAEELVDFLRDFAPDAPEMIGHARILTQAADLVSRHRLHEDPQQTACAVRDRYMADNVSELLDVPSAKVAVWAHNGHIAKSRYGNGPSPLGQHLREQYGDAYYALGLLFGRGAFRAGRMWPGTRSRRPMNNRIGMAGITTVEAQLATATVGNHLIDLRSGGEASATVREWLRSTQSLRRFGAQVPRWAYRLHRRPTVLAHEYDGLAYIATTTCSRPLPPVEASS
ncbi:erythromycin esterase family protein (plasmid) [Streptomyces sp. CA-294286]|uniref:erythromycin esterase family protein n=1 Tax=Streptomyces sp. CA-294286 TaxID=3240070 RepID=UPI003D919E16